MIHNDNLRAYFFLTITTVSFGMNANFGKLAVGEISPMLMVLLRWIGTVALMVVFFSQRFRQDWPQLKKQWPFLIGMGVLGLTAFNALYYVAAHTTSAINLGILQGSIPMFVLAGSALLYRTRVLSSQVMGIVLTMIGVCIAASGGDLQRFVELDFQTGDLLMIIACFLYSGYSVLLRKCPDVDPLALFTMFAIGALIAAIPLPWIEAGMGQLQWPTTVGWVLVILVTLFPSFLAQVFFIKGVALIGPGRAGIFFNLVPIFAVIIAVGFLGERFYLYHGLALALVLGGITLSEYAKRGEL